EIAASGQVNVDTSVANITKATLDAIVDDKTIQGLPPQLQTTLHAAEARGKLAAQIAGTVPLLQWQSSDLTGQVTLSDFNVAAGPFQPPTARGPIPFRISGGVANLDPINVQLLSGQLNSSVNVVLNQPGLPVRGRWQAINFDLAKLMRAQQDVHAPPGFQGQA